jgi:catechol 2,3-dioxygenase
MSSFHDNKTRYISKVSLRVVDIDKSIEFYNKVLGFEVINKEEESVLLEKDQENGINQMRF